MKRTLSIPFALVCLLGASSASAGPLIDQSAGLKLFLGGDIWTKPDNIPFGASASFADTAGGLGYGVAGYYELRVIKLVSLEADLAYQHGALKHKDTLNGIEYVSTMSINSWRLPLLAKLNIPVGLGRLWLGLGPEFTLAQSSSLKVETGGTSVEPGGGTRDVKPTFLTAGLGAVIELAGLEIPLEFRASKNLSQPADLAERASISGTNVTWQAESSWVLRLGAGVGLSF